VFARRKEISIMKYIGATDWFIRLPFVVEGIIIGLIGAIASFVVLFIIYNIGGGWVENDFLMVRLVGMNDVGFQLIFMSCLLGTLVGASGSVISIRKYLRV
jgi:cell division transport system permease protein